MIYDDKTEIKVSILSHLERMNNMIIHCNDIRLLCKIEEEIRKTDVKLSKMSKERYK
jgi:hypothetical protein